MKIPSAVILDQHRESDYFAGVNSPIGLVEVLPDANWTQYLPSSERQKLKNGDTYACVTFSALNSLETQFNYLIASKKITIAQVEFLNNNGFIDQYGKVNFSDRYTAKMSGTIQGQGNSLFNVANSIRHDGLLPESLYPSCDNVSEYYQNIPDELIAKAKEIYQYFDFTYEWIFSDFEKHLKQAPLQIATAVCSGWSTTQIIQKCDLPVAHATILYDALPDYWEDFDSYEPYNLKLAKDYRLPYVLKLLINPKNTMLKIFKETGKPDQYIMGNNGKRYLIYNYATLLALHEAGVVDKNSISEVPDISVYVRADDIICVMNE